MSTFAKTLATNSNAQKSSRGGGNRKNDLYNHFCSTLILAVLEWGINCGHFEPTYVSFDALGLTLEGLKVY